MENYIFGIRPIIEAIESGTMPEKVLVQQGLQGENFQQLFNLIRKSSIPHQFVPLEKLNRVTRKNHQGVVAYVSLVEYQPLHSVLSMVYDRGEIPLLLILDKITDVRNMGAIARSAECFGVHAIVLPERGGALINADAIKTSAGALMRIPVCREVSLPETIAFLQQSGIKVVAASERANVSVYETEGDGPLAVILGSEDKGVSSVCLKMADEIISIPMTGKTASLNVSVSAGIILSQVNNVRING
jgi:23S rRNA (guanosine2251-2'-O)-methyltransferase